MKVQHFFDPVTFSLTYIVFDETTGDCIVIDPILDFDPPSGKIDDHNLKALIDFITNNKLNLLASLETHAHADHLTGSQLLKHSFPSIKVGIGENIKVIQDTFKTHFHIGHVKADGSQFDLLFTDFQKISFGSIPMQAIPTPGHTPVCMSYYIADLVFTGDSLFMPDYGTGRCDFPKGSAKLLYNSIKNHLYTLPERTKVYVGHDYMPGGRKMLFETTIGENKKSNIQLKADTMEADYIFFRETRDRTLSVPKLLLPSIQFNIDAGHLPPAESNGKRYFKIPLSVDKDF